MFVEVAMLSCRLFEALMVALAAPSTRCAAGPPSGLQVVAVWFTVWAPAGTLLGSCEDYSK